MAYKKDTDKKDHEARVAAIQAHVKAAQATGDRKLADAGCHMMTRLDQRRATPFHGTDHPHVITANLPRPEVFTVGAFSVEFDSGYSHGLEFCAWRNLDSQEPELIARFPVAVSFDVDATRAELERTERRAKLLVSALAETDGEDQENDVCTTCGTVRKIGTTCCGHVVGPAKSVVLRALEAVEQTLHPIEGTHHSRYGFPSNGATADLLREALAKAREG